MKGGNMPRVEYNQDNAQKCQCGVCPVQTQSECVKNLMMKMKQMKAQMEQTPENKMPEPKDMPGLYCAIGKAYCQDLDPTKGCVCPTCDVWKENNLKSKYYCQKGNAEVIG